MGSAYLLCGTLPALSAASRAHRATRAARSPYRGSRRYPAQHSWSMITNRRKEAHRVPIHQEPVHEPPRDLHPFLAVRTRSPDRCDRCMKPRELHTPAFVHRVRSINYLLHIEMVV